MDPSSSLKDDMNKKRSCRGFRACWECKRRKLHGGSSYTSDVSSVSGLSTSNTEVDEEQHCPLHIGERMNKLEQLFEKFVCRKPSNIALSQTSSRSTLQPNESNEKPVKFTFGLPEISSEAQSITSIGDGILASQLPMWHSSPSMRTLVDPNGDSGLGNETIRRSLIALLPSQSDADILFESTNGWMILAQMYKPSKDLYVNKDPQSYALDMEAVSREHVIVIARTLLHLAICICCLPPEFDASKLSMWSLDTAMQNYVTTVTSLVTSSDEQMSTLPGLETLLLLAAYHINYANLRQAWLIIRRGLNLAHLMGFHRIIAQEVTPPVEAIEASKFIWRALVDADRFLGLHLRLPFAADDYPIPEDASAPLLHRAKLAAIARQITELDSNVTAQSYSKALALDEKLESVMKSLSKHFWDVPNVPSTARTPESAEILERLVGQMWHFELKILLHLPFLLRAPTETRYEYSKITALQASRNVIMRWFALRNAGITQAGCRFAEMAVYIATVTIALDIVIEMGTKERSAVQKARGSDFAMICRLIGEMEKLARASTREKIAGRTAAIIKKLLCSLDPSRRLEKTRLTLPYFGTIEISHHQPPVRPPFDLDSDTGKKLNTTATGPHLPVFSFVNNELWPSSDETWDGQLDFDIVLFDGLADMDTEGNWVF